MYQLTRKIGVANGGKKLSETLKEAQGNQAGAPLLRKCSHYIIYSESEQRWYIVNLEIASDPNAQLEEANIAFGKILVSSGRMLMVHEISLSTQFARSMVGMCDVKTNCIEGAAKGQFLLSTLSKIERRWSARGIQPLLMATVHAECLRCCNRVERRGRVNGTSTLGAHAGLNASTSNEV